MKVSVVVIVYNEEKYIADCIKSIINQSYREFELVIVDDGSTDNTNAIIKAFKDKRIKIVENRKNGGYSIARNLGVENSDGEIIFFTDADCVADKNWIEEGLKVFNENDIAGVTGRSYYVSKDYVPSIGEKNRGFLVWKGYATRNIAYYKNDIVKAGCFRMRYNDGYEDLDLALRILKSKKILHSKNMVIYHQKKYFPLILFPEAVMRVRSIVYLKKDYPDYNSLRTVIWRLCCPINFLILVFPPFMFIYFKLLKVKIKSFNDLKYIPYYYFWSITIRFVSIKTAIKERFFMI